MEKHCRTFFETFYKARSIPATGFPVLRSCIRIAAAYIDLHSQGAAFRLRRFFMFCRDLLPGRAQNAENEVKNLFNF